MKNKIKNKAFCYNGRKVRVNKTEYRSGGLAVELVDRKHRMSTVITVRLGNALESDNFAFVDENNNPGIGKWLEQNGIAEPAPCIARSGFCSYRLYEFK